MNEEPLFEHPSKLLYKNRTFLFNTKDSSYYFTQFVKELAIDRVFYRKINSNRYVDFSYLTFPNIKENYFGMDEEYKEQYKIAYEKAKKLLVLL